MARISATFWRVAEKHNIGVWICHVPSALNPADLLSRGDASIANILRAKWRQPCCEKAFNGDWAC